MGLTMSLKKSKDFDVDPKSLKSSMKKVTGSQMKTYKIEYDESSEDGKRSLSREQDDDMYQID